MIHSVHLMQYITRELLQVMSFLLSILLELDFSFPVVSSLLQYLQYFFLHLLRASQHFLDTVVSLLPS